MTHDNILRLAIIAYAAAVGSSSDANTDGALQRNGVDG
jgi:hypothetical protein